MKCVVCKQAETHPGFATVTLQRGESTFVMKDVPANVCDNCGESYIDAEVTETVLRMGDELARSGSQVDIRNFATAA